MSTKTPREITVVGYAYTAPATEVVRSLLETSAGVWAELAQRAVAVLVEFDDGAVPHEIQTDVATEVTTLDPWHDVTDVDWRCECTCEDDGPVCVDDLAYTPYGGGYCD